MPARIGLAQKAVVNLEFVCDATIRPYFPMHLRASESTPHLTICVGHIPDLADFVAKLFLGYSGMN